VVLRLLLEVWLEAREIDAPALLRARVANLRTGHHRALASPDQLIAFIEGELDRLGPEPRRWGGP
jgi:hypothetical protein